MLARCSSSVAVRTHLIANLLKMAKSAMQIRTLADKPKPML